MPRATFTGVRLSLIGPIAVTVDYPDVVSLETFMKLKEAVDGQVSPSLLEGAVQSQPEGNSNGSRKGNT